MSMSAEDKAAWLNARAGKLTASRMADAMAYLKNGQPSMSRTKLMHELLAERITGQSVPHVVTDAMQHGLDYEDEAIDWYVSMYGRSVRLSRFYEHPSIENFGATPDREVNGDGLIECKCPTSTKFVEWCIAGVVPPEHKPQMLAQLACSGKRWVGFLAYDPRVRDERKRLFMRKYEPSAEEIAEVEAGAQAFLDELDAKFDLFVRGAA